MSNASCETELRRLVEDLGAVLAGFDLPRIAGRIVGWLLVCDPPHQSADQLEQLLPASKGSISTNIRMLVQRGVVERVSLPGQRRNYYRISSCSWTEHVRRQMVTISALRDLAKRGLEVLADAPEHRRGHLAQLYDISSFFEREFPAMLDRFAQKKEGASS